MVFVHSTKVKCPECGHEWFTFRGFDDVCAKCGYEIKDVSSYAIGTGTAEDVTSQIEEEGPELLDGLQGKGRK